MQNLPVNEEVNISGPASVVDWKEKPLGQEEFPKIKELAATRKLDIQLLSETPPIVQVLNYWRLLYKAASHIQTFLVRKENRDVKTITISCKIKQHDLDIKLNKVQALLDKGNKVMVAISTSKREDKDQKMLVRQIGRNVKEHFSKQVKCEVDLETTEEGVNVTIDMPIEGLQKTEIEKLLENKEFSRLAGFEDNEKKPKKKKQDASEAIISAIEGVKADYKKRGEELDKEMENSLESMGKQEEARAAYMEYVKQQEREKRQKRRFSASLNINKSQAKFS